ncbi:hypothetical protein PC121_g23215 [Phytophthora cactorum]|nr:hypothetical protein PC120_g25557 [Phytophthora cactorum]KAG3042067.1 hypothetical protein PC121_g23215 [Phytophthora cactorum]KAG4037386.1 hypothetical protein PC123_g27050 [Phytophthora cactorum]
MLKEAELRYHPTKKKAVTLLRGLRVFYTLISGGHLKANTLLCITLGVMGRGPALTDIERGRILGLHEADFGLRKIARKVERSVGAVQRVIYVPPTQCKKPGPATSLSDRELRLLVRTASKGSCQPSSSSLS